MALLKKFQEELDSSSRSVVISFEDYLDLCKADPTVYAAPTERMLKAIGDPELFDTRKDARLSRIFSNKIIKRYPTFSDFYGMEEPIERIVSFFKRASLGLEESKQVLYLLGPVGGGKSSIAQRLRELIENIPVYVIDGSPLFESPLSVFNPVTKYVSLLEDEYKIPLLAVRTIPSPWLVYKLSEVGFDLSKLKVRKIYPSQLKQECVSRIEPGDENNQDISSLVGKLDIRMIQKYPQNHPLAYSYSGGLNRGNNGLVEFVEMFKTPIKMLNPLLTATQERHYTGTEAIGSMPFDGIILAHSNESEWDQFKNNKTNEAFLDRVYVIKVPYCLRVDEEIEIYEKILRNSKINAAPIAPGTLELLAQFCIMSRLVVPQNTPLYSKMRVYNGENIKNDDARAKPLQELRDDAGVNEGMNGLSTRFAFKALSASFDMDPEETASNPIHLMYLLKTIVPQEQFPEELEDALLETLEGVLQEKYIEFLEKDIRVSFLESFGDLCQNVFENYFYYADAWVQDKDFRDPDTGVMYDRDALGKELDKIEKPADIANPKDFRNDITSFIIRYQAQHGGKVPRWDAYEKMRVVVEKKVLASTDEILPVISFAPKRDAAEEQKHKQFVELMAKRGYTARQTKLLCEWYMRVRKTG
jgi:serine protein kinase